MLATGATGGIGLHIARQFADRGWTIHVGARDSARGEEAAAQVSGRVVALDVTDVDTIAAAAKPVPSSTSWSTTPASRSIPDPVTETDVEVFRRTYGTNVFGVVAMTNAFLPALRRSAHRRIVNLSSAPDR